MNQMIINNIIITNNRIDIDYSVSGEWAEYFNLENKFFVEYSKPINQVPSSIAVIPFVVNILPIAWVFNAEVIINEIDREFYDSINDFKQGYIDMYPQLDFLGKISVKKIIENKHIDSEKSATFFSGGVDGFNTLISHLEENPTLVTLWGSDVKLEDIDGWKVVETHTVQTAIEHNLDYVVIRSSFRQFLNEGKLSHFTNSRVNDGWWHGFQHGIGLIGHMAPYSYQYQIKKVYIASSFTIEDKGKVTCASDPTIDNFVRFNGVCVIHDGYEFNRQAKIQRICQYVKNTGRGIQLRVCWESSGGSNCCHCEKCYRTILGVIAEREDPRLYGFDYSDNEFTEMMKDFKKRVFVRVSNYKPIQTTLHNNFSHDQIDLSLKWFYNVEIDHINSNFSKSLFRAKKNSLHFIKKLKNAINKIK